MPDDVLGGAEGRPVGRRIVLGLLGLGALGMVGHARLSCGLSAVLGPLQARDPTGLVALFPTGNTFRYYSVTGSVARRGPRDYRLTVTGLVRQPGTHTLAELQAMPQTELVRDFQCVTGWRGPGGPVGGRPPGA